ncbi:MAG TPA: DNA polymerase III subunit alpha, partial [Chloroflexota bacterium]|nr:DNA polymerase III subunit alpha [Chloroflexota bacterium]
MPDSFVHLHCHSCYSLLDGLARIEDLVASAREQRMPALALTDHGTMFGAIEFYSHARDHGVKPIIGCEVYVADRPLEERAGAGSESFHLVLLAESETGYRNLIKLTTEAHLRGFYRKPRVDRALLERHNEGLICLSGCASGELATALSQDNLPKAEEIADWHREVFAGRYYLELQYHNLDFQTKINRGVVHLSQRLGLPLVATNDAHYVYGRQAHAHDVLLCVQTQTAIDDPKRMRMGSQEFYLKSPEQMLTLFGSYPGAISNTLEIADRCNLELVFGRPQLPRFDTPDGTTSEQYLRALCEAGLRKRYSAVSDELRIRLEYELSVIIETGFVDYCLLVYDVMRFARERGIAVGPGRGSAASSLVAYCLFVTNVDPIGNGLSFERFLNPERVTMPDMDLDFADDRRDEVFRYVGEKYGRERVAQIITFGTIGPRAGVRDVGRALGMSFADVDRVAKLIPFMCHHVAEAKERTPELQQLYDADDSLRRMLDTVEDLEGVARHASTHAAGVVISRDPLIEHVPLYKVPKSDAVTTQYAMGSIEKIGLLKMDFLGLRTLTILERAASLVRHSTGRDFKVDEIPLDHPSIYELLSSGSTFGVFQVDGDGMKRFITRVRPTEFSHVIALLAMYRPGPMDHIEEFAARKNGERDVAYPHPALREVLQETYGVIVYQEQVMQLASVLAGYSMGEADLVRRAMGKKKAEELARHRDQFIERAEQRGTTREAATTIFDEIQKFAGYAFNKAHSAAYAVLTCQTAYLKANFPREYMAGLLSAEIDNSERVSEALVECGRLGIRVLPPDVNRSELDFTLEDGGIRFGLTAIKHVGTSVLEAILSERSAGGHFSSLDDFCRRIDWGAVNKRALESLARCGALDGLGQDRKRTVENLDRLVAYGTQCWRQRLAGQASLFGDAPHSAAALHLAIVEPATVEEKIAWEQELLGNAMSHHPVVDAVAAFEEVGAMPLSALTGDVYGSAVSIGGLVRGIRSFTTKTG